MEETIKIDLGGGLFATVDAVDAHLAGWGWRARLCRTNTYAERARAKGGFQSLHRAIMGEPDGIVDHRDGEGLNCRRKNLFVTDHQGNRRNVAGAPRNSASGVLGVSWRADRRRWVARIFHDGRTHIIGSFLSLEEAKVARALVEEELWGIQPRRRHAHDEAAALIAGAPV